MRKWLYVFAALTLLTACSSSTDGGTSNALRVRSNAIYASDQKPGQTITVALVAVEKPSFVAIYENNDNPEEVIVGSSALISPGDTNDLKIPLTRQTIQGEQFIAIIQTDNGDKVFNPKDDKKLYVDESPIGMLITIDENAEEAPITTL